MRESWKVPFLAVLVLTSGCCVNKLCRGGSGLLPEPAAMASAAGEQAVAAGEGQAFYGPLAPGAWSRTIFTADSGRGFRVEVWDVHVGPNQKAVDIALPGAAVVEVLSGSGQLTAGGQSRELGSGATFVLAAGERFGLENTSGVPITLRVHVVIPAQP